MNFHKVDDPDELVLHAGQWTRLPGTDVEVLLFGKGPFTSIIHRRFTNIYNARSVTLGHWEVPDSAYVRAIDQRHGIVRPRLDVSVLDAKNAGPGSIGSWTDLPVGEQGEDGEHDNAEGGHGLLTEVQPVGAE